MAVAGLTVGHAVLSVALFLVSFGRGMARFDAGDAARAAASTGERVFDVATEILLWPIFAPLTIWGGRWANVVLPGLLGYIPLLLNSLIWALAIVFAWRRLGRRRAAKA